MKYCSLLTAMQLYLNKPTNPISDVIEPEVSAKIGNDSADKEISGYGDKRLAGQVTVRLAKTFNKQTVGGGIAFLGE